MSRNKIGNPGVECISKSVNYRDCKLENLNLEDNKLGDRLVAQLCLSLQTNSTVAKLNLSKNQVT